MDPYNVIHVIVQSCMFILIPITYGTMQFVDPIRFCRVVMFKGVPEC